ncbi:MAG: glycosyltransferase [Eudoraea sp.]|uniref:glycosyltransferase n=1 Tax=Eudoraea sp. TaxID=1979955 RepID=UPI003264CCCC
MTGFFKFISYLKSQFILFKSIKFKSPLIVHFQWLKVPQIDYYLLKLIKLNGVKIIITAHNVLPHDTGDRYEDIYKKIYSLVDAIIVHSNNTEIEIIEKFKVSSKKIHVIPHGILDIGQNIDSKKIDYYVEKFRSDYDLDKRIVFSALGKINDYKGYDLIVDAWNKDNVSNNEQLMLFIAGKGKHRKLDELKGKKNVTILNRFLLVEEFLAILKLTDFVLLPYTRISQSGILLTAINEKKRVVVSNIGGLADSFKFGEIGYILPELNYIELNKAIMHMALNVDAYPKEETWNKIFEYFDWENIGLKTQNLYSTL